AFDFRHVGRALRLRGRTKRDRADPAEQRGIQHFHWFPPNILTSVLDAAPPVRCRHRKSRRENGSKTDQLQISRSPATSFCCIQLRGYQSRIITTFTEFGLIWVIGAPAVENLYARPL